MKWIVYGWPKCELVTSRSYPKAAWATRVTYLNFLTLGAFKTGFKSAEWNIEKLMKASYNLSHVSPARRADYVTVTEFENFPHAFYLTRWVEDQKVAERICLIWGTLRKSSSIGKLFLKKATKVEELRESFRGN